MYEGFKDRAGKVKRLLSSAEAAFVLVTSPNPLTIEEALFFHGALAEDGIATSAVIVNRVHRDPHRFGGSDSPAGLHEALQLAQIPDAGAPPLSERLSRTLAEQATLADLDRREIEKLALRLKGVPLFRIPRLRRDVHDLAGLWQIDRCLSVQEEE
jgi:anion-transporting  ArsA/GET3 family ATPase